MKISSASLTLSLGPPAGYEKCAVGQIVARPASSASARSFSKSFLFTCLAGSASTRLAPDLGRRFPAEVVFSTFAFDQPRRIAWTSIHPPSGSYYGAPALVRDFRGG